MTPEEVETRVIVADRDGAARHSAADHAALASPSTRSPTSPRLRGRHRHLLGAPAGRPSASAACRRPAGRRRAAAWRRSPRRCREMFMFTIEGERAVARRSAHAARLDDPPAAAQPARRGRRQFAGRLRAQLRGGAGPRCDGGARASRWAICEARSRQQPQRRRGPAERRRGSRCWCAPTAPSARSSDVAQHRGRDRGLASVVRVGDVAEVRIGSADPLRRGDPGRRRRGRAGPGARPARRQCAARWSSGCAPGSHEIEPTLAARRARSSVFYDRGDLVERAVGTVTQGAGRGDRAGAWCCCCCSSATCARRWSWR